MGKTHKPYSEETKAEAIKRLIVDKRPIGDVSKEMGISTPALRKWRDEYLKEHGELKPFGDEVTKLTPEQMFECIVTYEHLTTDEQGAYLRKNGLYYAQMKKWRETCVAALGKSNSPDEKIISDLAESRKLNAEKTAQIKELENTLNDRNKVIAELNSLLLLQKKTLAWTSVRDSV